MYISIKEVKPVKDYLLHLTFENGEKRQFDMKPYLNTGIFIELKDISLFETVHISFDTIEWDNEADLDPEFLYKESKSI
jgi:hypothetical protein